MPPGKDLYLKMVSTDYLGEVYRLVMIKAAEAKLLSFGCSRDVLSLRWLGLDTLAEFLTDPEKGGTLAHFCREPEDREVGLAVGQAVLDRAAKLLCVGLASVLQFVGAGRDPKAPACVGLHGAAFPSPGEGRMGTPGTDLPAGHPGPFRHAMLWREYAPHRRRRRGPLFSLTPLQNERNYKGEPL